MSASIAREFSPFAWISTDSARLQTGIRAKDGNRFRNNGPGRHGRYFLEAGKKRLAGDTARAATSDEVKDLRREASALKEVVAELTLENRLLKKSMTADGRSNRGKRLRREDAA